MRSMFDFFGAAFGEVLGRGCGCAAVAVVFLALFIGLIAVCVFAAGGA